MGKIAHSADSGDSSSFREERNRWLLYDDSALLAECEFDEYQASGPGGQKRNRKYSAVRLKHIPTGIEVRAAESRSQKTNRSAALSKLRTKIAIDVRGASISDHLETCQVALTNKRYPLFLAFLFDTLHSCGFAIADTAAAMGISTGKLVKLLARDSGIWQIINNERKNRGMNPLKK